MAYFLVDYENVSGHYGLRGVEYLNENDSLIIFFSEACNKISKAEISAIKETGCTVESYQLKVARTNALDFYIATKVGMLIKEKQNEDIVIISRDKGFLSIVDFARVIGKENIVVASDVANAFVALKESCYESRRRIVNENMKKMDLNTEICQIKLEQNYKRAIEESVLKSDINCNVKVVVSFAISEMGKQAKDVYTNALHVFGRAAGLKIYRIIKEVNAKDDGLRE